MKTAITIITILLFTISICQQQRPPSHYLPNYIQVPDPLHIHIVVYNSTHSNIISQNYSLLYSLEQPALTAEI